MSEKQNRRIENYLEIAEVVSRMATCLRRRFGAVVANKDGVVKTTGYNGSPRKTKECTELGYCAREIANIPSGERYELCRAGPDHAEVNTIINAAREGIAIKDCIMYLSGTNVKDGSLAEAKPCKMCVAEIINVGITDVYVKTKDGYDHYDVQKWIDEYPDKFTEENMHGY